MLSCRLNLSRWESKINISHSRLLLLWLVNYATAINLIPFWFQSARVYLPSLTLGRLVEWRREWRRCLDSSRVNVTVDSLIAFFLGKLGGEDKGLLCNLRPEFIVIIIQFELPPIILGDLILIQVRTSRLFTSVYDDESIHLSERIHKSIRFFISPGTLHQLCQRRCQVFTKLEKLPTMRRHCKWRWTRRRDERNQI